jgi:hypothetical protein
MSPLRACDPTRSPRTRPVARAMPVARLRGGRRFNPRPRIGLRRRARPASRPKRRPRRYRAEAPAASEERAASAYASRTARLVPGVW